MEIAQKEQKKQFSTTGIWKIFSEALTGAIETIPLYCNPMLDTLDPRALDLFESPSTQPIYEDKCLEMALLHLSNEQKGSGSRAESIRGMTKS